MADDIQSWQRQNMSKGGGAQPAPHQMNAKTMSGPAMSMNSKIAKPTVPCGGMVMSKSIGTPVRGYADGGEVEQLKAEGLKASEGESVGLLKRLSMGNIDDEKSEAYQEFGAGRGQRERNAKNLSDEAAAVAKAEAGAYTKPAESTRTPEAQKSVDASVDMDSGSGSSSVTITPSKPAPAKTAARPIAAKPKVMDTGDETARLAARAPAPKPALRQETVRERAEEFNRKRAAQKAEDASKPSAISEFFSGADKRYLKSKMDRGETLTAVEKAQAKRAGLM
jgi:hypothetical protein